MRAADQLDRAVDSAVAALSVGAGQDWQRPAGTLEWTCRRTMEHVAHCLQAYALQLAGQAPTHYLSFFSRTDEGATTADLIELLEASGRLLSAVVRAAGPNDRGYHPFGMADAEGTAGMGAIELLVHTGDVTAGLGLGFEPPRDVCAWIVARMFPDRQRELEATKATETDTWKALRWATGRTTIAGLPSVDGNWTWHCAPLPAGDTNASSIT